jgi:hypothetical protein
MKKIGILLMGTFFTLSCNAQDKQKENNSDKEISGQAAEIPRGTWKVDKEYDEQGNLIRYDSIYSWSSSDYNDKLEGLDRDSTLQMMRSKFYRHFSHLDTLGFGKIFGPDSLFTRHFFTEDFFHSDFGRDFMDFDRMRKRMEDMQRELLDQYAPEIEKSNRDSLN